MGSPKASRVRRLADAADELVTVAIPCRNEAGFIERCLDSVQAQTHQALEILVVDGESDDETVELVTRRAAADPRITILTNPDRIVSPALNRALAAARARWIVRVDAHCTIPPDYVERVLGHLRSGRHGGVGGRKNGVGLTTQGRAIAAAMASKWGVGNSTYHHGTEVQEVEHVPFGAYPVALARALGGWDESVRVNQDFEFDHRIVSSGRTLLFDPAIRIDWHCRQSLGDLFRQYRRYGRGKAHVMRLHPGSTRPRHLVPPTLAAALVVAASPVVPQPFRRWLRRGLGASYGAVVLVGGVSAGRGLGGRERVLVPMALMAMHIGQGVGVWTGLLLDRHPRSVSHEDADTVPPTVVVASLRRTG